MSVNPPLWRVFFSFSSSSTSSEIRLLDTRLAARWSSRRIGSSLLFSLEKNFTLARKGIRRIEWVLVRMQKSDQCLRVVVYVIGLNEMESSTNCKWLHHPNFFFNFEFWEDLSRSPKSSRVFFFFFSLSFRCRIMSRRGRDQDPAIPASVCCCCCWKWIFHIFISNGMASDQKLDGFPSSSAAETANAPQRWTSFSIDCKHQHQDTVVWWRIYFGQQWNSIF